MLLFNKILFQQKREDQEVDQLFAILETITEIRDTQISTLREALQYFADTKLNLDETIDTCNKVGDIEAKYKEVNG